MDPLSPFLPPVGRWFRDSLGEPTPAQAAAWPHIAAGRHTLILAPTGSGKTLAAFLACLDQLWRQDPLPAGVQVLYVSPLKALNNDIHRNLQVPLAGVDNLLSYLPCSPLAWFAMFDATVYYCWSCDAHRRVPETQGNAAHCPRCGQHLPEDARLPVRIIHSTAQPTMVSPAPASSRWETC